MIMRDKFFIFRPNKFDDFRRAIRNRDLFMQDIAKKLYISQTGLSKKIKRGFWFSEMEYNIIKKTTNMTDYELSEFGTTVKDESTDEQKRILQAITALNEAMRCLEGYDEARTMVSDAKGLALILLGNELVKQRFKDL